MQVLNREKSNNYYTKKHNSIFFNEFYRNNKKRENNLYEMFYQNASKSKTYKAFCKKVYGEYLCQYGQVDMQQLTKLIKLLKINEKHSVLFLCRGSGLISEFISKMTGAKVINIDISKNLIKSLKNISKYKKVNYLVSDINNLSFANNTFDRIILIDNLNYNFNLQQIIKNFINVLKYDGQLGIFWESKPHIIQSKADNTRLGQVLDNLKLDYFTYYFTNENIEHLKKKKRYLKILKTKFISESNQFLYNTLINETKKNECGINNRFLFQIFKRNFIQRY